MKEEYATLLCFLQIWLVFGRIGTNCCIRSQEGSVPIDLSCLPLLPNKEYILGNLKRTENAICLTLARSAGVFFNDWHWPAEKRSLGPDGPNRSGRHGARSEGAALRLPLRRGTLRPPAVARRRRDERRGGGARRRTSALSLRPLRLSTYARTDLPKVRSLVPPPIPGWVKPNSLVAHASSVRRRPSQGSRGRPSDRSSAAYPRPMSNF